MRCGGRFGGVRAALGFCYSTVHSLSAFFVRVAGTSYCTIYPDMCVFLIASTMSKRLNSLRSFLTFARAHLFDAPIKRPPFESALTRRIT